MRPLPVCPLQWSKLTTAPQTIPPTCVWSYSGCWRPCRPTTVRTAMCPERCSRHLWPTNRCSLWSYSKSRCSADSADGTYCKSEADEHRVVVVRCRDPVHCRRDGGSRRCLCRGDCWRSYRCRASYCRHSYCRDRASANESRRRCRRVVHRPCRRPSVRHDASCHRDRGN